MFTKSILTSIILSSALINFSTAAPCFGPGGCINEPTNNDLCLNNVCAPITYIIQSWPGTSPGPSGLPTFALAFSYVDGYPIMGYAGPCMANWNCPALYDVAYESLYNSALVITRHNRYVNGY